MAIPSFRHCFIPFLTAIGILGFLMETLSANQVVWFSKTLSAHQTSSSSSLDASFIFEIGAFEPGFIPTEANTTEWAAKWTSASRSPYQTQTQVFGGTYTVESNQTPFQTTNRGYIWGFSTAEPTEWILIGDPSWVWPAADDVIAFPKQWAVAGATDILIGQIDTADGAAFFLQMGQVATGNLPITTASNWQSAHFTEGQLADAAISDWQADPDQDDLTNLIEMTLGSDPLIAEGNQLPTPTILTSDGQDYLQLEFDRSSASPVDYLVEVSFDRRNWNSGELFTQILVDTPRKLVVRSSIALNLLDQQFMRLVVSLQP